MSYNSRKILSLIVSIFMLFSMMVIPVNAVETLSSSTTGFLGTVGSPFHLPGEEVSIYVFDPDMNVDPAVQESVTVRVYSSVTDTTGFDVALKEEWSDGDFFIGNIRIADASNTAANPMDIGAAVGERVTVTYNDNQGSDGLPVVIETSFDVVGSKVAAPKALPGPGAVPAGTEIALSASAYGLYTTGAAIYYTLDGSPPDPLSPQTFMYDENAKPVINASTMIRAYAVNGDIPYSDIADLYYTISQVSGTVLDPDGTTGMSNVRIEVRMPDNGFFLEVMTDSQGNFGLGGLSDGIEYTVKAVPSPDSPYVESDPVTILLSNGTYSGGNLALKLKLPMLTGTVTNPDNSCANRGFVHIINKSTYQWVGDVPISSTGAFKIGSLAPGQYLLVASPLNEDSSYSRSEEYEIAVDESGNCTTSTVALQFNKTQLTGYAVNPDGVDLKGYEYHIRIRPISTGTFSNWGYDSITMDGFYKVSALPDGDYGIRIVPNWDSVFTPSTEAFFSIVGGNASPAAINLQLTNPQVVGSLTDPDTGLPVTGGGRIEIKQNDQYIFDIQANNLDGTFRIGGLDIGTDYGIQAVPPENSNYTRPNEAVLRINSDGSFSVKYKDGSTEEFAQGAPLSLKLGKSMLKGCVLDPYGNYISYGYVEIRDSYGMGIQGVPVDNNGYFNLYELADGNYWLIANQWNSEFTPSSEVFINVKTDENNKKIVSDINGNSYSVENPLILVLNKPMLKGLVVDSQGNIAPWTWVEIRKKVEGTYGGDQWMPGSSANENGEFMLGGLDEGQYILRANPSWNSDLTPSDDVTIFVDKVGEELVISDYNKVAFSSTHPLVLVLNDPQLTGSVVQPDGTTLQPDGWIEIRKKIQDPNLPQEWIPGVGIRNGTFSIGGLKDGTYVLKAYPNSNSEFVSSQEVTINVESDGTVLKDENNAVISSLVMTLGKAQFVGRVFEPDGSTTSPFCWVEIKEKIGDRYEWLNGVNTDQNGIFRIGGLQNGHTYVLTAHPSPGTLNTASQEVTISISSDGAKTIGEGTAYSESGTGASIVTNLSLKLNSPQVIGNVVSITGEPQPYGYVEIKDSYGKFLNGIGVDYEGGFTLGGLPDGKYKIKAHPGWNSEYSESEEFEISITDGNYSGGLVTLVLRAPQITGTVTQPDGNPSTWGWVEVRTADGRKSSGVPVENGQFKIGGLEPGSYIIRAFPDWQSQYSESIELTVEITGLESAPINMNLNLSNPLLTGTVMIPGGGLTPAKYGWIEVRKKNGDYFEWVNGTGINDRGEFRLSALEDGTYIIKAFPDWNSDYASSNEMIIKVITSGSSKTITNEDGSISYGQSNPLILSLNTPSVKGKVFNPEDTSIVSFGWVEISKESEDGTREWMPGAGVDQKGEFRLGKLEAGKYYIRVFPDWQQSYCPSNEIIMNVDSQGACTFSSISGTPITLDAEGYLRIKLAGVQLQGIVSEPNASGNAEFGWIEIQQQVTENGQVYWKWINGAGVDQNGEFKLGGLKAGTYRLKAYPNWDNSTFTASEFIEGIVIDSQGNLTAESITALTAAGVYSSGKLQVVLTESQITGKIKGPNGESVAFGWIEIRKASDDSLVTGTGANQNGEFTIGGLADGSYKVTAFPGWGLDFTPSASYSVVISDGGATIVDDFSGADNIMNLTNTQIRGRVINPDGLSENRGWIEVRSMTGEFVTSVGLDKDGSYRISGLAEGSYTIQAFADPMSNYTNSDKVNFSVDGSGNATGNFELGLKVPQATGCVTGNNTSIKGEVWVEIGDQNGNWIMSLPVANDGIFGMPQLEDGTYKIQAFKKLEGGERLSSALIDFTVEGGVINSGEQITLALN